MAVAALVSLALVGCGSDGNDAYSAPASGDGSDEPAVTDAAPDGADADDPGHDVGSTPAPAADQAPAEPNGEVVDVKALDNTFIDEEITVAAGTEVHWENRGRNDHDVVPVEESEDWGVDLEDFTPGDSYSHVFATPGTFRYYCTVHGTTDVGMIGTVIVT